MPLRVAPPATSPCSSRAGVRPRSRWCERSPSRSPSTKTWLASGQEPDAGLAGIEESELALRLGAIDEAEASFLALAESASGQVLAAARAGLGKVAYARGDVRAAVIQLEAARALEADLADDSVADLLGRAYAELGYLERAAELFRAELTKARGREDRPAELRFSVLLANALVDGQQLEDASELLESIISTVEPDDALARARVYWSQSRLHSMRGDSHLARRIARRALGLLEATEDRVYLSRAHLLLAFAELDAGDANAALQALERGRSLLGDDGTPDLLMRFTLEEARAHAKLGALDRAIALAMEAAGQLAQTDPIDSGRAYMQIAAAFDEQGDPERAIELYELAIRLLESHATRFLTEALAAYAGLLERLGRREEAYGAFKRAAGSRLGGGGNTLVR